MRQVFRVSNGSIALDLPRRNERFSEAGLQALRVALESVTAFHAQALTTYSYYEVIDVWLGPWGDAGYPLGYGRYYNRLFSTHPALNSNQDTKRWIDETTVKLQEAITHFIEARFKAGTLGALTEAELREAAFDSHPKAYTDGGLTQVAILDPALIPIIATIPRKEFDPSSQNFGSTVTQVLATAQLVGKTAAGLSIASIMPAHSGFLRRAAAEDERRYRDAVTIGARLARVKAAVSAGSMDYLPWLEQIRAGLNRERYDSQETARLAREVVEAVERRKEFLLKRYETLLKGAPQEIRRDIRKAIPGIVHGPVSKKQ